MAIKFKVKEIDNSAERLMCTGMIVSDKVLGQLSAIATPNLFTAKYTQLIATWCLDYWKEFEKAPRAHIQDVFESQKREHLDEDVADLIESLLISLNDKMLEDAQFNEDFVLEQAEKYIKCRKAVILCEDVLALTSKGRILEAEGMLAGYNIPKRPTADGDDVFDDIFWIEEEETLQVLFRLPKALDELIGPIERDSLISLLAPEKRGKTWFLLWLALTAYRQRCNVAFFSIGDMTKKQMRRRLKHMLTGRDPKKYREKVLKPIVDCMHNQHGTCPLNEDTDPIVSGGKGKVKKKDTYEDNPDHIVCSKCMGSREKEQYFYGRPWFEEITIAKEEIPLAQACTNIFKRSGSRRFKLFCSPPKTTTIAHINAQLDILQQQEDFVPDVVVIDYADLLDVEDGARKLDYRHQIDYSWMGLRTMSQVRNCAVITATQAKGETRKKSQVDQTDISEDKRKLAHVTAMLALNQTPAEKRQGLMRISNIATRDADFDTERNVAILQCLALGAPHLYSYPHKDDPQDKKDTKAHD